MIYVSYQRENNEHAYLNISLSTPSSTPRKLRLVYYFPNKATSSSSVSMLISFVSEQGSERFTEAALKSCWKLSVFIGSQL